MRLIDADALFEVLDKKAKDLLLDITDEFTAEVAKQIKGSPTVEAEPVVRCADCIYWQDNNGGYINDWCKWRTDETPDPVDYCSCGVRKAR